MWSHYADGHRGICLKLRRCSLTFTDSYGSRHPGRVKYSEEYPSDDVFFSSQPHEMFAKWLMTKSSDWSYEREWRGILQPKRYTPEERQGWSPLPPGSKREVMHRWHPLPQDALAGVILGCEISSPDEQLVREWLAMGSCTVPLFRAKKKPGHFALDKEKIG